MFRRIPRERWLLLVILVALSILPLTSGFYYQQVVVFALISVILAMGLSIVTGLAGQLSLGQSAFFTVGAYTAALLSTRLGVSFWLTVPASALTTVLASLLVGMPALRTRGIYLAFVTLMFSLIVAALTVNLTPVTGGTLGISGIPRPAVMGFTLASSESYYFLLMALTAALTVVTLWLANSRLGRAMVAVRDDETAARMLGFESNHLKLLAFVIAALFAGVAGSLYAHYIGFIDPEAFPPFLSILILMMIIIGGVHRPEGAIVGGLLISILPEVLRFAKLYWNVVFGAVLVLTVIALPGGLISLIDGSGRRGSVLSGILGLTNLSRRIGSARNASIPDVSVGDSQGVQPVTASLSIKWASARIMDRHHFSGESSMVLLMVEGISRHFGGVAALDNVSFVVPKGSIYGVIGPNGAGKSVLLNIVTGFLPADAGRVTYCGEPLMGQSAPYIASLGISRTFQEPRAFASLTVLENVLLAGQPKALLPNVLAFFSSSQITVEERAQAEVLIGRAGLSGVMYQRADRLSYGQKKLLALAIALRPDPQFILLDEPVAGLDPVMMKTIADLITFYNRKCGKTFLLVEHTMKLITGLCDRVLVLNQGKRLTEGTPFHVQGDPRVIDAYLGGTT